MALALTDRQKVGHLLRRFGLGASLHEMEAYVPLGPKGAMEKLLDFGDGKDFGDPMRFAFRPNEEAQPNAYQFRMHWIVQMLVTETPLREKLALFWHDHFAVLEEDVAHGLAVLDYMEKIRTNPAGPFREILKKMATSTAVMRQLNVEMVTKAKPNENFARELLELYTMGEGHYTEKDIYEVARAMTGWAYMDVYWRLGATNDERLRAMKSFDTPGIFYFYAPDAHIEGPKTVLGKTVESFDDVLDLLVGHPQTARYLCGKLWAFFAYPDPEEAVVERLATRFLATKGSIREVLVAMTELPEFWSERCYRQMVKTPVDYTISICRAQNLGAKIREVYPEGPFDEPAPQAFYDQLGGVAYRFSVCGMDLFNPPNVAGWDWGSAWISTNTMMRRREFTGVYTYYPVEKDGTTEWHPDTPTMTVVNEIRKRSPQDVDGLVNAFLTFYDCPLTAEKQAVLKLHFEKMGGIGALPNDRHFAWVCTTALQLLGSSPDFQLC